MNNGLQIQASEYLLRLRGLKRVMAERSIDLFLVTDQANFQYFCGYKSLFWISKSRPMALLIPQDGDEAIIISSTLEILPIKLTESMPDAVRNISYTGFTPAFIDAIVSEMKLYNPRRVAFDYGFESFGLGSLKLVEDLNHHFGPINLIEGSDYIWEIRAIKSPTEVLQKRVACEVATSSFFEALKDLRIGHTEIEFARRLTLKMIENGATSVPWLPVRFGRGSFPTHLPNRDRALAPNDFIWVDIGCVVNDSISDLNRVAKAGKVTAEEQRRYQEVRKMTVEILSVFRPGMTTGEAYNVYEAIAARSPLGVPKAFASFASRVGHGSGAGLTEPPSISANSKDVLREGMIIHIEPMYEIDGGVYQTEEVAVITTRGSEIISPIAPEQLPEVAI